MFSIIEKMTEPALFSAIRKMYEAAEKLFPEEYYMLAMYVALHPEDSDYGASQEELSLISNLMHLAASYNHARALDYLANYERQTKNRSGDRYTHDQTRPRTQNRQCHPQRRKEIIVRTL